MRVLSPPDVPEEYRVEDDQDFPTFLATFLGVDVDDTVITDPSRYPDAWDEMDEMWPVVYVRDDAGEDRLSPNYLQPT